MAEASQTSPVAAIETLDLRKQYGAKVAVERLSLLVRPGEVFGFLGPNGAGKTTTVKILLGLVQATSGEARILGQSSGDPRARARVGYLPENFRFHDWLTGSALLDFHGRLAGMSAQDRQRRIPEVLKQVGLAGRGDDRIRGYSKGMTQRIGLAQAIIHRPAVVLLDEPTSALDPIGRREVRDLIRALRADGMTVFLNSHLLSEIELVCDRVAIVDHGRVVQEGRLDELLTLTHEIEIRATGLTPAVLALLSQHWKVREHSGEHALLAVPRLQDAADVTRLLVSQGVDLLELRPRKTNLEDVFLQWVQGEEGGNMDVRPADPARIVA